MLKRRLKHNCSIVWMARRWKRRIGHMQNGENNGNESNNGEHCQQQQVPQNLFGSALLCENANMEEYFKRLNTFWDKTEENKK